MQENSSIFDFCLNSPPSDEEFREISHSLLADLCQHTGVEFTSTHTQVETNSWVTVKITAKSIQENLMDVAFIGIVSYSLRDDAPSIQSVLLAFSKGRRVTIGKDSILVSNYILSAGNGQWERFEWRMDEYGEWDCDELPSD